MDWNLNLKRLMGEATQLVRSGQLADATRAIQQTLGAAVARHSNEPTPASAGATPLQAPSPAGDEAPRWRSAACWVSAILSHVRTICAMRGLPANRSRWRAMKSQ